MAQIVKRPFKVFDGIDWEKHYFETSADMVVESSARKFVTAAEKTKLENFSTEIDNDYYTLRFPNGIIMQSSWATADSGGEQYVTFKYAFPHKCLNVICVSSWQSGCSGDGAINLIGFPTKTNFAATNPGQGRKIHWLAIGY